MTSRPTIQWLQDRYPYRQVLRALVHPRTARQISRVTQLSAPTCSHILSQLAGRKLIHCLNPSAQTSRVYYLTAAGQRLYRILAKTVPPWPPISPLPDLNWPLYGWLCFRHRSAVLRYLTYPLQPAELKRILRQSQSRLKISANNIRDIVKLFVARGLAQRIRIHRKKHWHYDLTAMGIKYREVLRQAEQLS